MQANQLTSVPSWNHQKTCIFLTISGGAERNEFACIQLILQAKFDDNPFQLPKCFSWSILISH